MTLRTYYTQRGMAEIGQRADSGLNCRSCGAEWTPPTQTEPAELYHEPDCSYLQQWHAEQAVRDDHAQHLAADLTPEEAYNIATTDPVGAPST